ncbi:MAG: hypothetical protein ACJAVN_000614 [Roseivirga sp.]|jgi:hypothetical protein
MLNFLRKLRRKEMKGTRYLKYAIGEIVLVVIGILITLSINNWNEASKSKKFEYRMLDEIKKVLDEDIESFTTWETYLAGWKYSTLYLIDQLGAARSPNFNRDSVIHHLAEVEGFGIFIVPNYGPYEALKSSGLDKISNDSLRNQIVRLYSRDLKGLDTWINEVLRGEIDKKFRLTDEVFDYNLSRKDGKADNHLII